MALYGKTHPFSKLTERLASYERSGNGARYSFPWRTGRLDPLIKDEKDEAECGRNENGEKDEDDEQDNNERYDGKKTTGNEDINGCSADTPFSKKGGIESSPSGTFRNAIRKACKSCVGFLRTRPTVRETSVVTNSDPPPPYVAKEDIYTSKSKAGTSQSFTDDGSASQSFTSDGSASQSFKTVYFDLNRTNCERSLETTLTMLPIDLLVKIMSHLPAFSIWSLRQTSVVFLEVFEFTPCFDYLHGKPGRKDRYMPFLVSAMTAKERQHAVNCLKMETDPTSSLCAWCKEVSDRGDREEQVKSLRRTDFCTGCRERHSNLFFVPRSVDEFRRGADTLLCFGQEGKITLCRHKTDEPLTWNAINKLDRNSNIEIVCTDRSHEPCNKSKNGVFGSALPRMLVTKTRDSSVQITVGRDIPLLEVDPIAPPPTVNIRKALDYVVAKIAAGSGFCRHMRDGEQLRGFAHSGICACFSEPNGTRYPDLYEGAKEEEKCSCRRKQYLDCRDCGAIYVWFLTAGTITLSYRYDWNISKPTSPAWLNLLDDDDLPDRLGLFNDDTRHLFWCDLPGCATGWGLGWEDMVKEDVKLVYQENWLDNRDYSSIERRAATGRARYRLPNQLHYLYPRKRS